jgi:hypothetical protein
MVTVPAERINFHAADKVNTADIAARIPARRTRRTAHNIDAASGGSPSCVVNQHAGVATAEFVAADGVGFSI